jgi:hypothetical protein
MTLRNRGAPPGFEPVAAPVMYAAMKRANWRSWFFRMKSATAAMSLDPSCFAVLLIKSRRRPRLRGRPGFLAGWPAQGGMDPESGGDDDPAELTVMSS